MYSNAVELCRQPAEQRADAPCKKRRQNAENEIFRHIQQIARNDDLPQPAVVQIERPDAGKVRNTDQVIYEEPGQPGDDRAAEGKRALAGGQARRKRRRNEPDRIAESNLHHIGKTSAARKNGQADEPDKDVHRHRRGAVLRPQQKPRQHSHDRLKGERDGIKGYGNFRRDNHQHHKDRALGKLRRDAPSSPFCPDIRRRYLLGFFCVLLRCLFVFLYFHAVMPRIVLDLLQFYADLAARKAVYRAIIKAHDQKTIFIDIQYFGGRI